MTQAHLDSVQVLSSDTGLKVNGDNANKKVSISLGNSLHISIFSTVSGEVVINIRKGTRSVSISKSEFEDICTWKESVLYCHSFIERNTVE